jgi:hypothetical protein
MALVLPSAIAMNTRSGAVSLQGVAQRGEHDHPCLEQGSAQRGTTLAFGLLGLLTCTGRGRAQQRLFRLLRRPSTCALPRPRGPVACTCACVPTTDRVVLLSDLESRAFVSR